MTHVPFISICVPAYKNIAYLTHLLESISEQSFSDFEVIVTDDSPDDAVRGLIDSAFSKLNIRYYRNLPALGTPENWNRAILMATGAWIKIMHDDDWFSSPGSLAEFAAAARQTKASFLFSSYDNVCLDSEKRIRIKPTLWRRLLLRQNPVSLLSKNIVGPPSAVLYKNDGKLKFDSRLKWLVDIHFYSLVLKNSRFSWIEPSLVCIGINEHQVTRYSSRVHEVEIPEYFYFLGFAGEQSFYNILFFDAWWRLMRNLRITSVDEIRRAGYSGSVPATIKRILEFQRLFPYRILSFGPSSKLLMLLCFLGTVLTLRPGSPVANNTVTPK